MSEQVSCKRCGLCCVIPTTGRDCQHLVRLKSGRTLCRVYKTRLGRVIGKTTINGVVVQVRCVMREDVSTKYEGCPFNEK